MRFMIGNMCVSVRNCPHDIFSRGIAGTAQEENEDCVVHYTNKGIVLRMPNLSARMCLLLKLNARLY